MELPTCQEPISRYGSAHRAARCSRKSTIGRKHHDLPHLKLVQSLPRSGSYRVGDSSANPILSPGNPVNFKGTLKKIQRPAVASHSIHRDGIWEYWTYRLIVYVYRIVHATDTRSRLMLDWGRLTIMSSCGEYHRLTELLVLPVAYARRNWPSCAVR